MNLTIDQQGEIWDVIRAIGHPEDAPHMILAPAAIDWLTMRGFIQQGDDGLRFAEKGWKAHKVLESGNGTVPEIDGPDFEG
jgi:hypothetical protein